MQVRPATQDDLPAILDIYNEAVLNTTASYDYEPRTLEQRQAWFEEHQAQGLPILVACRVQPSDRSANRDRLACADFAGDDTERGFLDAVMDPCDCFGVGVTTEQLVGGNVLAERCAREPEMCDPGAGDHWTCPSVLVFLVV